MSNRIKRKGRRLARTMLQRMINAKDWKHQTVLEVDKDTAVALESDREPEFRVLRMISGVPVIFVGAAGISSLHARTKQKIRQTIERHIITQAQNPARR